jgi:hypothetical protein
MSAQCQHGVLRYECPKCDRARKKREMGIHDELVQRLIASDKHAYWPAVALRHDAADAIVQLQTRVAELEDCVSFNAYRALEKDLAAARADARRYRWLRHKDNECNVEIPSVAGDGYLLPGFGDDLDATIDAALAGEDAPKS